MSGGSWYARRRPLGGTHENPDDLPAHVYNLPRPRPVRGRPARLPGDAEHRAYLDPGSGSLLWQALIAALFGGMFYFRRFIAQVKEWIGGGRKTADSEK